MRLLLRLYFACKCGTVGCDLLADGRGEWSGGVSEGVIFVVVN